MLVKLCFSHHHIPLGMEMGMDPNESESDRIRIYITNIHACSSFNTSELVSFALKEMSIMV